MPPVQPMGAGGPPPPPPGAPQVPAYQLEVMALVRAGNKIEAIKLFREATGCGLAEAKEAVDRLG
jgi:ribosomal protein L7/L12